MPPDKPAPERFLDLIRKQQRGKLKIYLGFAAGVGKTYEMLQEGNRLRKQGVDVVIGYVEPHARPETIAQIGELEQVPCRRIDYSGITLQEMDLQAILARRPTIALVDELAHTNAPGSGNPKRYLDVEELLRDGISVITTLNIQHLESLHDIVEQRHRRAGQGAAAGLRGHDGRPDSQRRSFRGRPPRAAGGGQDLSAGARSDGAGELLHAGKTDAASRAGDGRDRLPPGPRAARGPAGRGRGPRFNEQFNRRVGADHGLPQLAEPPRRGHAPQGGTHRRPLGRPLVRPLCEDAAGVDGKDRRRHRARAGQEPRPGPAVGRHGPRRQGQGPREHNRRCSPRSTASRTSCSAAAASPGTAACSGHRSSTACNKPSMEPT